MDSLLGFGKHSMNLQYDLAFSQQKDQINSHLNFKV